MTRWDALTTVCGYLRAGLLGGEREPERDISWEVIIEVASFHYVTPALAWCLRDDASVPSDVGGYFKSIATLNDQRNERMLLGLARCAGLLNEIGIEPVLLKGAAQLVEGLYPEPSLRLLGDVDILIPANRSAEADAALKAAGFGSRPSDVVPPPSHHHLPMLHDPESGMGVELHTDVISRSPDAVISTAWFCELVRPALFRNQRVRLPEPTRHAGHTIFHSEIFHSLYALDKIQLRHLLDLALIRARHERAIDWGELDHRFSAAGFGEMLATYLDFAEALFGQPAPKLRHAPRSDAMAKLRVTESRNGFQFEIERLKAVCDMLQTELSHMTASRDRFQLDIERLKAARDMLQTELSHMTGSRDRFQSKADGLDVELARIAAARDEAIAELGITMRANAELECQLASFQASRSWRLTSPLRTVVTALRLWSKP